MLSIEDRINDLVLIQMYNVSLKYFAGFFKFIVQFKIQSLKMVCLFIDSIFMFKLNVERF